MYRSHPGASRSDSHGQHGRRRLVCLAAVILLLAPFIVVACGGSGSTSPGAGADVKPMKISDSEALLEQARSAGTQNKFAFCERILADYADSPEAEEARYILAVAYQNTNQNDQAVEHFRKLVEKHPAGAFNADAHQFIWSYERAIAGDDDGHRAAVEHAIADLGAYLEKNPSSWLKKEGTTLAYAHLEKKDWDGAVQVFATIAARPASTVMLEEQYRVQAQYNVAKIRQQEGKPEQALEDYERCLELLADNSALDNDVRAATEDAVRAAIAQIRADLEG